MNDRLHWEALFGRVCDGLATEDEIRELNRLLRQDTTALDAWIRYTSLHGELVCGSVWTDEASSGSERLAAASVRRKKNFSTWRPFAAAAAGLVFGILTTSVAWAYASPRVMATASRLLALVDGSFEKLSGRLPSGFPSAMGVWSGDESEVVEDGRVPVFDGRKVLRFIRAEGDPGEPGITPTSCDVFQLVDLHGINAAAADGETTLEMTARFLDVRPAGDVPIRFTCRIYVFAGTPDALRDEWPLTRKDALASGSGLIDSKGGAPTTWHTVSAKVLLPRQADFAVVQLVAGKSLTTHNQAAEFGEQYADDVRLTLKTQPMLPVRLAK